MLPGTLPVLVLPSMGTKSDFQAASEHAVPHIRSIMAGIKDDDGKKAAGDLIVAVLLSRNLAYKERMKHRHVAIHPDNRDGAGVLPSDVLDLFLRILRDGWSWVEVTGRARAFEVQLGDVGRQQLSKNKEWTQAAGGMLADIVLEDIRILSVSCTHTSQGLKGAEFGIQGCPDESLNGADGCLSREKVIERCPSIAEAMDDGLEWVVIRREVDAAIPELAGFLQEAGNIGHNTRKTITKMQALLQIHRRSSTNMGADGQPRWDAIAKSMESNNPHLEGCMHPSPDAIARF